MIQELNQASYGKVRQIFYKYGMENHPVFNSIIHQNNPGKIYVDNLDEPKTALVWAQNEIFFLGGEFDNTIFNSSLEDLITNEITKEALEIGEEYFQVELYPEDQWIEKVEEFLKKRSPKKYYRWASIFCPEKYIPLPNDKKYNPEGYSIERISNELIVREKEQKVFKEIRKFWRSINEFLDKGLGFVVMEGDRCVNCCISVFVSDKDFEIGINTYELQDRKKGFATLAARAFLEYCLSNHLTPHWTTEMFRVDSIAIAEKLGFVNIRQYCCLYFPY